MIVMCDIQTCVPFADKCQTSSMDQQQQPAGLGGVPVGGVLTRWCKKPYTPTDASDNDNSKCHLCGQDMYLHPVHSSASWISAVSYFFLLIVTFIPQHVYDLSDEIKRGWTIASTIFSGIALLNSGSPEIFPNTFFIALAVWCVLCVTYMWDLELWIFWSDSLVGVLVVCLVSYFLSDKISILARLVRRPIHWVLNYFNLLE